MKIFVSYNHSQTNWVYDRLEPCLKSGGADVIIDRTRFVAGPTVIAQMDAAQAIADRHILVLSHDYLNSQMCLHEMNRAIALDPGFTRQLVVPVKRDTSELPTLIAESHPLYVDLTNDSDSNQWGLLLSACGAALGVAAPAWLAARDEILCLLLQDHSINLVVKGAVRWQGLITDLISRPELKLAQVDLEDPATVPRRGLIGAILSALGAPTIVSRPPEDLPQLGRVLDTLGRSRIALGHFDLAIYRQEYDVNLFAALRYIVMNKRQLVLLIQSRAPFLTLIRADHPLSQIDLKTVELRANM
jgi:hypothetical protein